MSIIITNILRKSLTKENSKGYNYLVKMLNLLSRGTEEPNFGVNLLATKFI